MSREGGLRLNLEPKDISEEVPRQLDNSFWHSEEQASDQKNDLQTFDHRSSLIKWMRYPKEVSQMERGQPDLECGCPPLRWSQRSRWAGLHNLV